MNTRFDWLSSLRNSCLAAAILILYATTGSAASYSDVIAAGNPLLYWNFNEVGNTDDAIDQVGSDVGDNLKAQGNATRVASTSTTGGLFLGRAASFDGTAGTNFFTSALSPPTDPDAWAIEMWVRPTGTDPGNRFQYLLESRGAGNNNAPGVLFDYGSGKDNNVEIFHAGTRTGTAGPVLTDNTWQHLVIGNFGAANDRVDYYLNGVSAGSTTYTGDSVFGTAAIAVGGSVPADNFNGQIDELAVYDLTGMSVSAISAKLAALATHYSVTQPGIPGDANKDGVVNALDFNLISQNLFTTQSPGTGGDLDLNSVVDFADFRIWKNAAGQGAGASLGAFVPEPTSIALALSSLLFLSSKRRAR